MKFNELNENNYMLFAIKFYNNPHAVTKEDFEDDLKRIKYIKRLLKRYKNTGVLKTHLILNCRGVTRSDFKYFKNTFYLLEINTQPGMTKLSLVPEIASYRGITFLKLIEWMLNDATKKK